MKKLFLFAMILSALQSFGQTPDSYIFTPYTQERFRSSDSILVGFQLSTNSVATASITSVIQSAGPTVKFALTPQWISGQTVNQTFWLQGLAPGTYSFTATAKSGSGTTGTQTKTFTVIADPVCPVCPTCPPIPAPRIATSITLSIYGVPVTIPLPAAGVGIKYNDGSTQ
jgi:hypothetical protein